MDDTRELLVKKLISRGIKSPSDLALTKRNFAKKYKIQCPANISLLKSYHKLIKSKKIKKSLIIESLLRTRPIRSLSGIVNISVLTKTYPCPGKCIYCPQEKGLPKSYVSGEPAVERAKKLKFNPYLQVKKRTKMLEAQGHPTDKIELRIVGGTWSYYPKGYQRWFVEQCFRACNDSAETKISNYQFSISNKFSNPNFQTIYKEQRKNETAKHRIVGLSVETRPDFINSKEIKWLRELGVTTVEFGVQSIYDNILKLNKRGHTISQTILATKLLKDAGFKVLYQMMPNLYGSDLKKDLKMFKELFTSPDFQPDLLKIYPCALIKNTDLYKVWLKNKYNPYTEKQLINLLINIKRITPRYVRIQRITRDIPSSIIIEGPAKISNVRQVLKNKKVFCECIRCREVKEKYDAKEKLFLLRENYNASGGKEIFLSFENRNKTKLYSLLRIRITSQNQATTSKMLDISSGVPLAIIRELHTFGQQLSINPEAGQNQSSAQHKGLGKKLILEAEKIAKRLKIPKIFVISAVGARDYYRKLGYKLENTYMVKNFLIIV